MESCIRASSASLDRTHMTPKPTSAEAFLKVFGVSGALSVVLTLHGMVETLSIAVIGAPGVGKTSIIRRFVYNDFSEGYSPTQERYVYRPSVILNGVMYDLKILDVPPIASFPSSPTQVGLLGREQQVCKFLGLL
ncbi:hypothetical protein AOLI_G00282390 [Acnodon oligacanthus]